MSILLHLINLHLPAQLPDESGDDDGGGGGGGDGGKVMIPVSIHHHLHR